PQTQTTAKTSEQIPEGSLFGITSAKIKAEDHSDATTKYTLEVGIGARSNTRIDHSKVKIQVFFYDMVDDNRIVLTDANVDYQWITPTHDWTVMNPELLSISYVRPEAEPISSGHKKYFGYVIHVYYNDQLQATEAEPKRLLELFPPPVVNPSS